MCYSNTNLHYSGFYSFQYKTNLFWFNSSLFCTNIYSYRYKTDMFYSNSYMFLFKSTLHDTKLNVSWHMASKLNKKFDRLLFFIQKNLLSVSDSRFFGLLSW